MTGFETIIRGAEVLTPTGLVEGDLALAGGKIAAILPRGDGAASHVIEGNGLTLMPGAIDIHAHVRAPAFPERGTVESETRAAAAGGITTLFEMPITKPCCNSAERVAVRRAHFESRAHVNFGLYAAPGEATPATIQAMLDEGVVAFKLFTTAIPPGREDEFLGLAFPGEAEQLRVLQALAQTGLPVVVHAESADLLAHFGAKAAHLDPSLASTHSAARPAICEALAVAKLLTLNMEAQAKLHIAHVTSAQTVDVLRRFAGTSDFSAETCPHYLLFTEDDVARVGVFGKVNPPIRKTADQDALWSAIADGTIGHVTTDHASFSFAEKHAARGNFLQAPPGSPGFETLVPTMLDAVVSGRVDLTLASDLISGNAARRFGLAPCKGRIEQGADADLMLVELGAGLHVDARKFFTRARDVAHLFDGMQFGGRVVMTIVNGQRVFSGERIVGEASLGQFTRPGLALSGVAA